MQIQSNHTNLEVFFFKKIVKRFIGNYWIVLESIYLGWKFFRKMSNDSWWWRSKASGLWWTRQPTLEASVRYLNSRKVRPSRHIDRNNSTTSSNPILHVRQTITPCLGSCVMEANVGMELEKTFFGCSSCMACTTLWARQTFVMLSPWPVVDTAPDLQMCLHFFHERLSKSVDLLSA